MKLSIAIPAFLAVVGGLAIAAVSGYSALYHAEPISTLDTSTLPSIGSDRAPHELVVITDYACPSCRKFHAEVMPALMKELVDTGQLRVRILVFPVKPGSTELSRAVYCTRLALGADGLSVIDRAYDVEPGLKPGPTLFTQLAGRVLEDSQTQSLLDCTNSAKSGEQIEHERNAALIRGVTVVPTMVLDQRLLEDPWTLDSYRTIVSARAAGAAP